MKNPFFDEKFWLMEEGALVQLLNSGMQLSADAMTGKKRPYKMNGNIAVIKITGSLNNTWHYPPYCSRYDVVQGQIKAAVADYSVRSIMLDIDSPGGTCSGCEDLSLTIKNADKSKPVYAFTASKATSAAYWLGSQARYFAAGKTANLGSIGVIAVHLDYTGMYEEVGIKPTIIRSGEFKALGHHLEKLSDKARKSLQSHFDKTCQIFIEAVASGRKKLKISESKEWAEGRVFLGEDAKTVGLIDRVCSRDEIISHILKEANMNAEQLRAQYPAAVSDIENAAKAEAASQIEEANNQTAAAKSNAAAVAEAMFGPEAGGKLKAALDANLNAEQINTLGLSMNLASKPDNDGDAPDADANSRQQILNAIQANDQGGPAPGSPAQAKVDPLGDAIARKIDKGV
ncbi:MULTISPECIES: signal peptide peptidase SppA [unclassified Maridesulfovibrio]|uniref:signal peptide peptidase SppA n=1 Tax=unclassified Maridesulfovibrio TaxID=2794999 RepID=UPI003B41831F